MNFCHKLVFNIEVIGWYRRKLLQKIMVMYGFHSTCYVVQKIFLEEKIFKKKTVFESILLPYKKCVTGNKGCKPNSYLLTFLMSIPFNKLPWILQKVILLDKTGFRRKKKTVQISYLIYWGCHVRRRGNRSYLSNLDFFVPHFILRVLSSSKLLQNLFDIGLPNNDNTRSQERPEKNIFSLSINTERK